MNDTADRLRVLSDCGCEQYIEMTVAMTGEKCSLPKRDPKCRREFKKHVGDRSFTCIKVTMAARWKSQLAREKCKDERTANGRWQDVESYAAQMLAGEQFPPGMFVHPSITDRSDGLLVPIDGARRLMAYLETGALQIPVVIICLQEHSIHFAVEMRPELS